jgi:hypothetical protein
MQHDAHTARRPPDATAESLYRLSARLAGDPDYFASPLACARLVDRLNVAAQAAALGLDLAGLATLALCKTPRADSAELRAADLRQVADRTGVPVATLERLLTVQKGFNVYAVVNQADVFAAAKAIRARTAGEAHPHLKLDELDTVRLLAGFRQADFGEIGESVWVGDEPAATVIARLRGQRPGADGGGT